MPFPNFPDKHKGKAILSGQDMIAYRRQIGRFPKMTAPEGVIICLETSLPKRMRWRIPYRKVGRFIGDMLIIRRSSDNVGVVVNLGVGASTVAALAEELIAWGTKKLILLTWAGVLQHDIQNGDVIVCDRAIRDEGTSYHYQAAEKYAHADAELTNNLSKHLNHKGISYLTGTTWTTSAPYRETVEEVQHYQSEGVLTVEMEAASLFTVAQVHKVQATGVFVTGDSLANLKWEPPKDIKTINQSFNSVYTAIVDFLKKS